MSDLNDNIDRVMELVGTAILTVIGFFILFVIAMLVLGAIFK